MAAQAAHSSFPSRPYTSGLGRPASTAPQTAYNAPQTNLYQNPSYNAPSGFGGAGQQRLERERAERAERERREEEERGVLDALTEEQREEINEAVRGLPTLKHLKPQQKNPLCFEASTHDHALT